MFERLNINNFLLFLTKNIKEASINDGFGKCLSHRL